jgi:hypothetical protein
MLIVADENSSLVLLEIEDLVSDFDLFTFY